MARGGVPAVSVGVSRSRGRGRLRTMPCPAAPQRAWARHRLSPRGAVARPAWRADREPRVCLLAPRATPPRPRPPRDEFPGSVARPLCEEPPRTGVPPPLRRRRPLRALRLHVSTPSERACSPARPRWVRRRAAPRTPRKSRAPAHVAPPRNKIKAEDELTSLPLLSFCMVQARPNESRS